MKLDFSLISQKIDPWMYNLGLYVPVYRYILTLLTSLNRAFTH